MGIGPFSNWTSCTHSDNGRVAELEEKLKNEQRKRSPKFPNPNPKNFDIKGIEEINRFTIVVINYPDCTNYEGNKILVFKDVTRAEILSMKMIDPHFCDGKHLSPVARFEPTPQGLKYARQFCLTPV